MGPFALDRLLDIGDLLEAINLASGDVSRAQDDAIRSHAAAAARSVRLAERLGRGDALLSDASVASELEAVLERFQPARDGGLLHWLAVNAAGALGTDTRLLCASAALTALPEPANPGLAYPLIVNFCIAQEAFTKDKQALFLTGAETLQACLRHPAADPVRGLLQRWLDDAGWRGRVARALDATYEALLREDPGLWMRLAGHAASFGDPALAETVLRRAFERRPDEAQLPQQLAFLLDSLGRAREAAVFAGAAAQAGGDNAHVLHNASIIYLRAGETSESVRLAREAARMEPANAWFHVHLSAALEAAEDFSAAADAAAEAARLAPDDPVIAARRDRLTPPAEKA